MIKNKISFTRFLDSLNCDLRLGYYWSAKSADGTRIIFTIWADLLVGDEYVLRFSENPSWTTLPGAYELKRHLADAHLGGAELLGVFCYPVDGAATKRERDYYDEKSLGVLQIEERNGDIVLRIVGEVSTEDAVIGPVAQRVRPMEYSLNDMDGRPEGVEIPQKNTSEATMFRRDRMVRDYALKRSGGRCEFCGRLGFSMVNGKNYVEVHHILALGLGGADTVKNVIALCAEHHREAHFGADREQLNSQMLSKMTDQG